MLLSPTESKNSLNPKNTKKPYIVYTPFYKN